MVFGAAVGFRSKQLQVARFYCLYKLEQLCNLSFNIINPKEENQCLEEEGLIVVTSTSC